ncbi:protein kinase family protein [Streptomyces sp. NPDC050560]|uniref:protein kinase family protein n=1 Tax=Streptomyces sp. NPDC050560 TaxID=3365630 RepID=UPI0037984BC3
MVAGVVSRGARLAAHAGVSGVLSSLDEDALLGLLDRAVPVGSGIGGSSAVLRVAGTEVFVKRVPLTDLEREPGHEGSTADLFGLPAFCHYGVGAVGWPGFGAWRELAVHTMTTGWVLAGDYEGFPLMYHWRVLPGSVPLAEELADVGAAVAYWGGLAQVRRRIETLQQSSASVVLFLEYFPQNLHEWLGVQVGAGEEAVDRACVMVDGELAGVTSFLRERGLVHFDAHFENFLTDGRRLYLADYGLALSRGFDMAPEEAGFFAGHQLYDRCYTLTYLVNWLVTALYGYRRQDGEGRLARVRAYADGERPAGIPREAAAVLSRHAPLAAVVSDFNRSFRLRSRRTPYPLEAVRHLGSA